MKCLESKIIFLFLFVFSPFCSIAQDGILNYMNNIIDSDLRRIRILDSVQFDKSEFSRQIFRNSLENQFKFIIKDSNIKFDTTTDNLFVLNVSYSYDIYQTACFYKFNSDTVSIKYYGPAMDAYPDNVYKYSYIINILNDSLSRKLLNELVSNKPISDIYDCQIQDFYIVVLFNSKGKHTMEILDSRSKRFKLYYSLLFGKEF